MTELENTDSTPSTENITVTSDAAFERVTSDIKMEGEEDNGGYLKQNTAWLVQEIPNISFVDIADTLLESKKTLYGRQNWNVVVWTAGKSIEVVPQDLGYLYTTTSASYSWEEYNMPLDGSTLQSNLSTYNVVSWALNTYVSINTEWYYEVEYDATVYCWWTWEYVLTHWFRVNNNVESPRKLTTFDWYHESIHNKTILYLEQWDEVWMYIKKTWDWDLENATFSIKYLFNSL